jgi:predicted AAA+ superfamily ATPase
LANAFSFGSSNTVNTYISYFIDSYLLFQVSRFSFSVKKRATSQKKVYAIDTGLAANLSLSFSKDSGRMLENLCFLHFKRLAYDIFYYKNVVECDFVICKNTEIICLVQVCYSLNADNYQRETKGLISAMEELKNEKGFIVTMEQKDKITISDTQIEIIPLWEVCTGSFEIK